MLDCKENVRFHLQQGIYISSLNKLCMKCAYLVLAVSEEPCGLDTFYSNKIVIFVITETAAKCCLLF